MTDIELLPCGHVPNVEDDRVIEDQCFVCNWATPYRKQANKVNEIKSKRGTAETDLVKFCRSSQFENGMDGQQVQDLFEKSIKIRILTQRLEAAEEKLKNIDRVESMAKETKKGSK